MPSANRDRRRARQQDGRGPEARPGARAAGARGRGGAGRARDRDARSGAEANGADRRRCWCRRAARWCARLRSVGQLHVRRREGRNDQPGAARLALRFGEHQALRRDRDRRRRHRSGGRRHVVVPARRSRRGRDHASAARGADGQRPCGPGELLMKRAVLILILAACKYPALPALNGGDDGGAGSDALPPGAPMLAAVEPASATVGTTIALEGTFSDPMTVEFPGGATATATVLGPHRATVVVPTGATSGPLDAMTGGVTTGSVAFRTPSFVPGLAAFRTNFVQVAAARMAPVLAVPRSGAGAVVVGHDLYVIGGMTGTTPLGTVEHALINADGTRGTFSIVTGVALVTARSGAATVALGGYVYAIGGANASGPLATVERAKIQSAGSLATFATVSGVTLGTARSDAASAVAGDSLYIVGGTGTSGKRASSEAAVIDPDSSLEAFTASAQMLATPRAGAAAITTAGSLYVLGGDTSAGATPSGVTLKVPRAYFAAAVVGTSVFAIGGTTTGGTDTKLTDRAAIASDGTLGNFATLAGAPATLARHGAALAVARDHVFVLGGLAGTTAVATVEHSGIATHGMLGAFARLSSEPLPAARAYGASVLLGDHLYLIGGINLVTLTSHLDVTVATVQADGSLGPFSTPSSVALTTARIGPSLAVLGDFLYVIGGQDPNNNNNGFTSLERAPIAADGTLGTFAAYTTASLSTGRYLASAAIVGSSIYVIGGTGSGAAPLGTVDEAAVDSSGSISFFFRSGSTVLTTARADLRTAVLGGFIWAFGGLESSGLSSKVIDRAPIQPDNSHGYFAVQRDGSDSQMFLSTERALTTPALIGDEKQV